MHLSRSAAAADGGGRELAWFPSSTIKGSTGVEATAVFGGLVVRDVAGKVDQGRLNAPYNCGLFQRQNSKKDMRPLRWLTALFAPIRRAFERPHPGAVGQLGEGPGSSPEPELDVAEEFQKLHRGLRRLSLASDRSGEILQAVSARLDEMQQRALQMGRAQRAGVVLEETDLLRVLDQLDSAASLAELPTAALASVAGAKDALLQAAGWQPIAVTGVKPEGVGIRIAEFIGESSANGPTEAHIHRILQQGYRRADGTLLRPGVVIAAADITNAHGTSLEEFK